MNNKLPKITKLKNFVDVEDLYICAIGFEDRSLISNEKLFYNNFKTKNTLIIHYKEYPRENESDGKKLEHIWNNFSNKCYHITYSKEKRLEGIKIIKSKLNKLKIKKNNITINVSSLQTYLQAWLINYAFENFNKIRIVYTQPKQYGDQNKPDNISSGIGKTFTLSEFTGEFLPGYSSLLIIFLGYDYNRAKGIYEYIQPNRKVGILPTNIKSGKNNQDIYDKHKRYFINNDEIIHKYSIFELNEVIKELEKIREDNIKNSNIIIALNGSKLHSLAALLFAKKYSDIQIIISYPKDYHPENYSHGGKHTFEIIFDKTWLKNFCSY